MPVEPVALISRCAECEAAWLPADEERWRAYLGSSRRSPISALCSRRKRAGLFQMSVSPRRSYGAAVHVKR
jgi:hypothetical protein